MTTWVRNLFTNPSFETGTPPTGWTVTGVGAVFVRSTDQVIDETYSGKLTRVGNNCSISQALTAATYVGHNMLLGVWAWASIANAVRVRITDNISGDTVSVYHTGSSKWEWLSVSKTVSTTATTLGGYLEIVDTDTTAYFDDAMFTTNSTPEVGSLRAWVNFNGTGTPAIRASGNVSSITDNGTGDYTVNFTTAMPDANYAWCASIGDGNLGSPYVAAMMTRADGTKTDSALRIQNRYTDQGASGASDVADCNVIILR